MPQSHPEQLNPRFRSIGSFILEINRCPGFVKGKKYFFDFLSVKKEKRPLEFPDLFYLQTRIFSEPTIISSAIVANSASVFGSAAMQCSRSGARSASGVL